MMYQIVVVQLIFFFLVCVCELMRLRRGIFIPPKKWIEYQDFSTVRAEIKMSVPKNTSQGWIVTFR